MDFYTAGLYFILLSDHNDIFSKYNKRIVTDYSLSKKRAVSRLKSLLMIKAKTELPLGPQVFAQLVKKCYLA